MYFVCQSARISKRDGLGLDIYRSRDRSVYRVKLFMEATLIRDRDFPFLKRVLLL